MKIIKIFNQDLVNRLHIGFIVGTTCNYKCHYCFDGCNDGKYRFPSNFDLIKTNLSHVINVYKSHFDKTNIRIHISGGEPTLWPMLGEFAEYFSKEMGCKISLSTNGTRTMRFWQEYARYFDDIGISVHNEACDPDHVIEVMDWVYNNEPDVLINSTVLMDPFNWDRSLALAEKLKSHPTPWVLKVRPVLFNGQMLHFTDDQLKYIQDKIKKIPPADRIERYKELKVIQSDEPDVVAFTETGDVIKYNTFKFLENDWQHFKGWKCNLGIDRLSIERDGSIQGSCGAKNLFGLLSPLSIYDSLLPEKFKPEIVKETICPMNYCICATDIRMTKENVQL